MRLLIALLIVLNLFLVIAAETPHTPEVITANGLTTVAVSFFNTEKTQDYTAVLEKSSPAVRLETDSTYVNEGEFGSFNLRIGEGDLEKGVYFDTLKISNSEGVFHKVPIIIGIESRIAQIKFDISIEFDPASDISVIAGETVLSPTFNVYKLDFNDPSSNSVLLTFSIYSIDGDLLLEDQEIVSVSRQASFNHFFNLGNNLEDEVLIVASVKNADSVGLDLAQVSINNFLFSPPRSDYSSIIYISVFIFLLSSVVLISYLWYNRSLKQTKDWKSQIEQIRKTKFSDAARGLRKLVAQRNVLQRAYSSRYISKSSFDSAIAEIDRVTTQLKKRL